MSIDFEIWQWIYLPLFFIGLCLCLHYGCFTKTNILAWFTSYIFCHVATAEINNSTGFCITYTIIATIFMLIYFYGVKEHAPISEVLAFTFFTATSFGVVDITLSIFLWMIGILH